MAEKRDDDKPPSPEALARLTASLPTLAQAMPALLEQFRALARSLAEGAVAGKIVDVAEEQRLAAFVQFVKLLGREHEGPAQALALEPLVAATLAVMRAELGRARVVKVYAPAPLVIATERQLGQLLLELFGHVKRALDNVDVEEQRLTLRVGTTDAGWALVELEPSAGLTDTASDAALATARAIVAELGGRLRIAREPGPAAALRVELPPARAPATDVRA
jgi:C4-dicarboxylate-specific signal transduction histidine kinase